MTIALEHYSYSYDHSYDRGTTALTDVSAQVPNGIVGLIGGNGSGKSTLLKALAGRLSSAFQGQLRNSYDPSERLYLPEETTLPPFLKPKEILEALDRPSRTEPIAQLLGVTAYENKLLCDCSLGMQKRVILTIALSSPAKLLLLDEPFNGIDVETLLILKKALKEMGAHTEGRTIIVASHQLDMLEGVASHCLVLHKSYLLASSTIGNLLSQTGCSSLLLAYEKLSSLAPPRGK